MYKKILEEIISEFKRIEDLIEEYPNDEGLRRIMIRSIFSGIKSFATAILEFAKTRRSVQIINQMQQGSNHENLHKSFFEICAIHDKTYKIDDSGEIRILAMGTSLRDRILFSLKTLGKTTQNEINPKNVEGWNEFTNAIKIRNRITHPKSIQDLKITDEDYKTVVKGFQWLIICNHRATGGKIYK